MPKRKAIGGIPIDPNESGPNPQFGELHDLPRGVNRQTSVLKLDGLKNVSPTGWARLTYTFPECLGIKETLDNAAKTTSCIPSVKMDVPINLPVIRNVVIEEIQCPRKYTEQLTKTAQDGLSTDVERHNRAYILTGDDQLTTGAPSMFDETTSSAVSSPAQMAALSDTIYAKIISFPEGKKDTNYDLVVKPTGWSEDGWIYGKAVSGTQGLTYADVAQKFLQPSQGPNEEGVTFEMNNIQSKGHLLLKDHVNLFFQTKSGYQMDMEVRVIIDYTTKSVSLSSLLVWQQQLTEFLPKQVRWRCWKQAQSTQNNGWTVICSRGTCKEEGNGNDPSSKTAFPDIVD